MIRLLVFAGLAGSALSQEGRVLRETWQDGYSGKDAGGPQVLGYWRFEAGAETEDSSGRGQSLRVIDPAPGRGVRSGGALESFPGYPESDRPHGARTLRGRGLSPEGAFTLEMWIQPKPDLWRRSRAMLLDKKYASHNDYQWFLVPDEKAGTLRAEVSLGFGDHSRAASSGSFRLEGGRWHHLAFTYDGAGGCRFLIDGSLQGETRLPGAGRLSGGDHVLGIGERVGSNYTGCPAFLDEVRICRGALEFRRGATEVASARFVFERMEKAPRVTVRVRNFEREPMRGASLRLRFGESAVRELSLPDMAAGGAHEVPHTLDCSLRPDAYALEARLGCTDGWATADEVVFRIVPRLPARMPVLMWGIGGGADAVEEMKRAKEIGFTHFIGLGADYDAVWRAGRAVPREQSERLAAEHRMLDEALALGMRVAASISPESWLLSRHPEFAQVDRAGKPHARTSIIGTDPRLPPFWERVGASVGHSYGAFPAFEAALVDTEVRDSSQISFSQGEKIEIRRATGADVPEVIQVKSGIDHARLKDFPRDRVVADDDPILKFYRWWWRQGDGWNALHSALHRGLHSVGRAGFWTWFDPAVRAASISGSGGSVDVLSHWTYTYPDPLRIGLCADQLFAMARENGLGQRVMKMTQLIWYRSQTAPMNPQHARAGAGLAAWEDHDPGAAYITIAPMHLREAFWAKLARPVRGIMYHGWQSLVPTSSAGAYRHTHPDTQHELRRLAREVLEPLGPALLHVPDAAHDVAFLQSFTSEMFTRKALFGGGNGWAADAWLAAQHAHLQGDVIYDETVMRGGLGPYRILFMADCDVLPRGVVEAIRAWQAGGGLVVGDESLCPAIRADVLLPSYRRVKRADLDKAEILKRAGLLRAALEGRYTRKVECTSPDVIARLRRFDDTDYVFMICDRREFGDYVGQHGLVMENGVGVEAVARLRRPRGAGHVYDLVAHREVLPRRDAEAGSLEFNAADGALGIEPCGGRVFMVAEQAIEEVEVVLSAGESPRNRPLDVTVRIVDPDGKPLRAVVPVLLEIRDPAGRMMEWSGHHAAVAGVLKVRCDLAGNDRPGLWTIVARELASGRGGAAQLRVR